MTDPAPAELFYVEYDRFLRDLEELARQLEGDAWRPDFLVGVGRGGLVPAAYLSHRVDIPMLSVDHSSGEACFADELLQKLADKGKAGTRILIIDDINDSGSTISYLRRELANHGCPQEHLRIAVLLDNVRSKAKVDYRAGEIDRATDKRWFVFPWEAVAKRAALLDAALAVPERLA